MIWDYGCDKCGAVREVSAARFADRPHHVNCECGGMMTPQPSSVSFKLKGAGGKPRINTPRQS